MDKKLIALFRKLFALDDKALPDSISAEDFGKLIEKSDGKLFIKPEDFKNLQKIVSQKDVDFKKVEEDLKKLQAKNDDKKTDSEKSIDEMKKTIINLSTEIKTMNLARESDDLAKNYPDILPELLIGKTKEEIVSIVDKQRAVNKKLYGDSQHFAPGDYSKESDVDEAIEDVKKDTSRSGENSAVAVMNLERQKDNLSNSD